MEKLINTPFENYRNLVCYDRTPYIVLSDIIGIKDVELFFLDRFLGFDFEDGNFIVGENRFHDFLTMNNIESNININIMDLEDKIQKDYLDNGFTPCVLGEFEYPDPKEPFKLSMKYVLHKYNKKYVRFTRPSSLDPLHDVEWNKEDFERTLISNESEVELTVYKNCDILNNYNELSFEEKINCIFNEYYNLSSEKIKYMFNSFINGYSPILKVRDYHKNKLPEYLTIGIDRNKYSDFIRRIDQMLFPQILAANYLLKNSKTTAETELLISNIRALETQIEKTAKIINFFFIKQDEKIFNKYLIALDVLNNHYNSFLNGYNDLLIEIIEEKIGQKV